MSNRFISFVAAVLLLGTVAILAFGALRHHWPPDLAAVYFGASAFAAGEWQSVYAAPSIFFGALIEDAFWLSLAREQGVANEALVSFVYPPLIAVLVAPLTKATSVVRFVEIGVALELACICLTVFLARSIAGDRMPAVRWAVAALAVGLPTVAVQNAFYHAQPQIIITAMILLAFVFYQKNLDIPAGLVLAFAGSIKLAPLFLGIIFLADRRWRAAVATAVGAVAFAWTGIALAGVELQLAFLEQIGRASAMHLLSPLSYSVAGVMTAVWGNVSGVPIELLSEKSFVRMASVPIITAASYLLLFAGTFLILTRTRYLANRDSLPIRLLCIWCLLSVFGPLGWAHYAIGPVLLLPSVFVLFPRKQALLFLTPIVAGLSLPSIWMIVWLAPGVSLGSIAAILALLALPVAIIFGAGAIGSQVHDDSN